MSQLNPRQREAVRYIDGPLLVLAGAGSGKTRVITQKISYLVRECGIEARNIAAVTFTNKAAREMKQRVAQGLGKEESRGLKVSTFHNLGLNILRREGKHLGYKTNFSIYDVQDCQSLLKDLMIRNNVDDAGVQQAQWQISNWKSALIEPQQAQQQTNGDPLQTLAALLYEEYDRCMRAYSAMDFDDLIRLPVMLFQQNREVLEHWQNRIRYLLVDEYQDTNASQYRLVQLLVGPRAALTVVGDDDQSIYGWRGAQPQNLEQLQRDFQQLKVIKLEQNYRSTGCILKAANHLIANNPHVIEKQLWSELGFGEPLKIIQARDEHHEAERVASLILQHKFQNRSSFADYAILYRGNHQSQLIERSLRECQIPYHITGGTSFFAYSEVKDILAYLRLIGNDDDDHAFLRIVNTPRREIGPATLEKLANYASQRGVSLCVASYELGLAEHLPDRAVQKLRHFVEWLATMSERAARGDLKSLVSDVVKETDYELWLQDTCRDLPAAERKMENVNALIDWLGRLIDNGDEERDLSGLIAHLQLMDILDRQQEEERKDAVQLLTLHAAKGLEFPHVFMIGVEENILPHHTSIDAEDVDEERRLAYVGITRAQKGLTFSYAARRRRAGEVVECQPSRFLDELPEDTVVWETPANAVDPEQRQEQGRAHLSNLRDILGVNLSS